MGKYKSIAVIYGSDSSEWEVSCRSGEYVASQLDAGQYDVYQIFARFGKWSLVAYRKKNSMRVAFPEAARPEIDKDDFSVQVLGEKVKFDYAYIMQHGCPGETGQIQGYLEILGVPFSTCSSFVSAVAFDKFTCKCFLDGLPEVRLCPHVFVRVGEDYATAVKKVADTLSFPVFVKPTNAGSSFGITKVWNEDDLMPALRIAFKESPTVIVEQGAEGRELTCAVYRSSGELKALPVIEIITDKEFFDYDAKYNGFSEEVCPAQIDESLADEVRKASEAIYARLGCNGVVRFDFISAPDALFFLEANTIPGMTSASLVPKMVRAAGMNVTDFLTEIIENQ